jgi:predicted kinase
MAKQDLTITWTNEADFIQHVPDEIPDGQLHVATDDSRVTTSGLKMGKVIMLKGLPGSGKTTWAKEQMQDNVHRVNKDDLRAMLDDGKHSNNNEKTVLKIRDEIVEHYLSHGHTIIVDDTNLAEKHTQRLRKLADKHDAVFEIVSFTDVPLQTCLERNVERANPVPEKVIRDMYNRYIRKAPKYVYPMPLSNKPQCIIVDIDGTLAHMEGRSPFEWHKVGEDYPDIPLRELLDELGWSVILLSGRSDECRKQTVSWLEDNDFCFDELHMRESGNNEPDTNLKWRMFREKVLPYWNPILVIDDRDCMVDMWRKNGVKCLQAERGDF